MISLSRTAGSANCETELRPNDRLLKAEGAERDLEQPVVRYKILGGADGADLLGEIGHVLPHLLALVVDLALTLHRALEEAPAGIARQGGPAGCSSHAHDGEMARLPGQEAP
uniref:Uncharacterized protein n=1 Tax=Cereibacter sphaeroides (strain ATCC 17025 / ATH 2.4.3) TaxID=349102 RepID=A4WZW8_CERS5